MLPGFFDGMAYPPTGLVSPVRHPPPSELVPSFGSPFNFSGRTEFFDFSPVSAAPPLSEFDGSLAHSYSPLSLSPVVAAGEWMGSDDDAEAAEFTTDDAESVIGHPLTEDLEFDAEVTAITSTAANPPPNHPALLNRLCHAVAKHQSHPPPTDFVVLAGPGIPYVVNNRIMTLQTACANTGKPHTLQPLNEANYSLLAQQTNAISSAGVLAFVKGFAHSLLELTVLAPLFVENEFVTLTFPATVKLSADCTDLNTALDVAQWNTFKLAGHRHQVVTVNHPGEPQQLGYVISADPQTHEVLVRMKSGDTHVPDTFVARHPQRTRDVGIGLGDVVTAETDAHRTYLVISERAGEDTLELLPLGRTDDHQHIISEAHQPTFWRGPCTLRPRRDAALFAPQNWPNGACVVGPLMEAQMPLNTSKGHFNLINAECSLQWGRSHTSIGLMTGAESQRLDDSVVNSLHLREALQGANPTQLRALLAPICRKHTPRGRLEGEPYDWMQSALLAAFHGLLLRWLHVAPQRHKRQANVPWAAVQIEPSNVWTTIKFALKGAKGATHRVYSDACLLVPRTLSKGKNKKPEAFRANYARPAKLIAERCFQKAFACATGDDALCTDVTASELETALCRTAEHDQDPLTGPLAAAQLADARARILQASTQPLPEDAEQDNKRPLEINSCQRQQARRDSPDSGARCRRKLDGDAHLAWHDGTATCTISGLKQQLALKLTGKRKGLGHEHIPAGTGDWARSAVQMAAYNRLMKIFIGNGPFPEHMHSEGRIAVGTTSWDLAVDTARAYVKTTAE
jgi:hypothetical protein